MLFPLHGNTGRWHRLERKPWVQLYHAEKVPLKYTSEGIDSQLGRSGIQRTQNQK